MSNNKFGPVNRRPCASLSIDPAYSDPRAMVAAMLDAGHRAIAAVARGGVWEGEADIVIGPEAEAEAERSSLLWRRVARHFQFQRRDPMRSPPHIADDPARSVPS